MSRKKKGPMLAPWSAKFTMSRENNDHVRLHDYLDSLADDNRASEWMRDTLIANLPAQPGYHIGKGTSTKAGIVAFLDKIEYGYPVPDEERPSESPDDEVTYDAPEDIA